MQDNKVTVDTESSSTEASASEPEFVEEMKMEWQRARAVEDYAVKGTSNTPPDLSQVASSFL